MQSASKTKYKSQGAKNQNRQKSKMYIKTRYNQNSQDHIAFQA